jgi:hypothetical protein
MDIKTLSKEIFEILGRVSNPICRRLSKVTGPIHLGGF